MNPLQHLPVAQVVQILADGLRRQIEQGSQTFDIDPSALPGDFNDFDESRVKRFQSLFPVYQEFRIFSFSASKRKNQAVFAFAAPHKCEFFLLTFVLFHIKFRLSGNGGRLGDRLKSGEIRDGGETNEKAPFGVGCRACAGRRYRISMG
jgi:hypothetical protein